jgi:hypothetical protein
MNQHEYHAMNLLSRREFLRNTGLGIGAIALAALLAEVADAKRQATPKPQASPGNPLAAKPPRRRNCDTSARRGTSRRSRPGSDHSFRDTCRL